jgi:hypothetical protein
VLTGLIQLQSLNNEAKATIAYLDASGHEVIWLQAHDYLTYPSNRHHHFSIEAADSTGAKQTRLGVGYGADVVDVTVNQADLVVNRNQGRTNGNVVMSGEGGGGSFKHEGAFSLIPSFASNATHALRVSLEDENQITLAAQGSAELHVGSSLIVNEKAGVGTKPSAFLHIRSGMASPGGAPIKLTPGALLRAPEEGSIEYDGWHLYVTLNGVRRSIVTAEVTAVRRTPLVDCNYTITALDSLIAYTSLHRAHAVTLPPASEMANQTVTIKDESGEAERFPIAIVGTVDGVSTKTVAKGYGSVELYSTGSAWFTR